MLNILFLCTGNICRSPLAEGILKDLAAKQAILLHIDSAGTENYHTGSNPDSGSLQVAEKYGLHLHHKARQLTAKDFEQYDYILAMDKHNMLRAEDIAQRSLHRKAKLMLIREFDTQKDGKEVEDPYFRGAKAFEACYHTLLRCCQELLKQLK
jgi:protein-tyrosine phosphatase